MNQMILLEQLQEAAVDPNSDLGEVLRRCKVLAARLKSPQLEDWLLWESNGYPDDVDLPDYRVWPVVVKGHFAGPFGSEIWREYDAVENTGKSPAIEQQKVTQIFYTTVHGGAANIVGTTRDSVVIQGLQSGDFNALSEALASSGVETQDLAELRKAIEADPTPSDANAFGPKVSEWIATMISKAASGSWKVGIGAGGSLLAGAIAKYYGL